MQWAAVKTCDTEIKHPPHIGLYKCAPIETMNVNCPRKTYSPPTILSSICEELNSVKI